MKEKGKNVQDIRPGDTVSALFLVAEKNLAASQKGACYLNLRLRDRTGDMEGRVWDHAEDVSATFRKGDVVRIRARAVQYRNVLQLSIQDLAPVDPGTVDLADFLPRCRVDADAMFSALIAYGEGLQTPCLRDLFRAVFLDASIANLFRTAPAAKGFHHVCLGGLLEHTLSVTRLLERVADHYPGVNRDLLMAGGMLHDIGKIYEFSSDGTFDYTDRGRLIGHVVLSVEIVDAKIAGLPGFPEQTAMELRHLILSHHGLLEYGSPKRPKTVEALIVHYVDDLDAKVNAFQGFVSENRDGASDWTPYHRLFERYLYKPRDSA